MTENNPEKDMVSTFILRRQRAIIKMHADNQKTSVRQYIISVLDKHLARVEEATQKRKENAHTPTKA